MSIPSVSGDEAAVGLWLRDYLVSLGWNVELQPVGGGTGDVEQDLLERSGGFADLDDSELMVEGDSNKEIGRRLGISPRTVEIHRGNMMRKLNARSPSDAVRLAMYAGLDATKDDERLAA